MLGRLTAEKDQHILLKAVKQSKYCNRIKVVIAGRGQCEKKLNRLAETLPNGAEIGFLSESRKNQLLATADLFVHCSSVELEGMAVLEAMGAGLPVLVAEGSETAASTLALPHFRFPVGDVSALATKIDWLIEHPEERLQAAKVYREAAESFPIEKCIESMEAVYRDTCASFHKNTVL